jgi:hypothetical protein
MLSIGEVVSNTKLFFIIGFLIRVLTHGEALGKTRDDAF